MTHLYNKKDIKTFKTWKTLNNILKNYIYEYVLICIFIFRHIYSSVLVLNYLVYYFPVVHEL